MRQRTLPFLPVLVAAALGLTAGNATAATLFTSAAHTTRVSVGTAASISGTTWRWTSGTSGSTLETCSGSTLSLTVRQNNDAKIIGSVTSGSFSGCAPFPAVTPTFSGTSSPWTLTVSGTGVVSGTRTQWTAALHNFSFDFGNGNYRGNLGTVGHITAWQPTATGSPLCLDFNAAGSFVGPLTGDGRLDANYCFEGGAAAWSLTN